jgi:hypothetical protein
VLILLQQQVNTYRQALGIEGYTAMLEEMEPIDADSKPTTPVNISELH